MTSEPHSWPEAAPTLPYFHPARPTLGDTERPLMLRPDGTPFSTIIPSLTVRPNADGSFTLWGFLPMDGKSSAPREANFADMEALWAGFARWLACPEKFAVEEMGWWPRERTAQTVEDFRPRPQGGTKMQELTIDDLI